MKPERFKTALLIQEGASNRRVVSRKLHEAIVECQDEGGSPDMDSAVFLILHQLTFLITGHDFSLSEERLATRWNEATKFCQDQVKAAA